MESGILVAGLTSLTVGWAMTLLGWNVVRQNRRREAARTALLSQMAFPGGMPGDAVTAPPIDAVGLFPVDEFRRESSAAAEPLFSRPEPLGALSRRTLALGVLSMAIAFAIGALFGFASLP